MNNQWLVLPLPLCILFCMGKIVLSAQAPAVQTATAMSNVVERYGKFESAIEIGGVIPNPYDYDQIVVQGIFTGPNGQRDTVEGFYQEQFTLQGDAPVATGRSQFTLRYSPTVVGLWTYTVQIITPGSTSSVSGQGFTCVPSDHKGFIRTTPGSGYLSFDGGQAFVPLGHNICWPTSAAATYRDYQRWLGDLQANGGNFFRLWLCHWGIGLEWNNRYPGFSGLKRYNQLSAWHLDQITETCARRGLYFMLCLNHHGQYSTKVNPNWADNPYNTALGGPIATPQAFFSDAQARALHRNRLRYIAARWGYAAQIQAWELFNEVDLTDEYDKNLTAVLDWHAEMAAELKRRDPNRHIVTTSASDPDEGDDLWELDGMEMPQIHVYRPAANLEAIVAQTGRELRANTGKPSLVGEYGLYGDGRQTASSDPNGIHLHNVLWASLFSGAAGSAMTWWWDNYVAPRDLYYHYAGLSKMASGLDFAAARYQPAPATVEGGPLEDAVFPPGAGFGAVTASQFTIDGSGAMTPGLNALGSYLFGTVWNTQLRNPPAFSVRYPVTGQFKVRTGGSTGQNPVLVIKIDGQEALRQPASVNQTYAVNVPPGQHRIEVDNQGTDWMQVAEYIFEKTGRALNAYLLQSADRQHATGWLHRKAYNWQFVRTNGAPTPASGVQLLIPGLRTGLYQVEWFDCRTGDLFRTASATANAAGLRIDCPDIQWDVALRAIWQDPAVAVANPSETTARLYPTPLAAGQMLHWQPAADVSGEWTATIRDVAGRVLLQQIAAITLGEPTALTTTALPPGQYTLDLQQGAKRYAGFFVVGQ